MAANIGTVAVTAIPNPMRQFAKAGWKFSYDEESRFVGAEHPLGGKFSICEVAMFVRSGGRDPITYHEVGLAIAAWFNEKSMGGD